RGPTLYQQRPRPSGTDGAMRPSRLSQGVYLRGEDRLAVRLELAPAFDPLADLEVVERDLLPVFNHLGGAVDVDRPAAAHEQVRALDGVDLSVEGDRGRLVRRRDVVVAAGGRQDDRKEGCREARGAPRRERLHEYLPSRAILSTMRARLRQGFWGWLRFGKAPFVQSSTSSDDCYRVALHGEPHVPARREAERRRRRGRDPDEPGRPGSGKRAAQRQIDARALHGD